MIKKCGTSPSTITVLRLAFPVVTVVVVGFEVAEGGVVVIGEGVVGISALGLSNASSLASMAVGLERDVELS